MLVAAPKPVSSYYGSGLNSDSLGNIKLGTSYAYKFDYRFRATHTNFLSGIRPYFIWSATKAGYHLGTGGTIQVQLQTDDGANKPSGNVLATLVYDHPVDNVLGYWPLLTFTTPPALVADALYHLVFSNIQLGELNELSYLEVL